MYSVPSPMAKLLESKSFMSGARHFLNPFLSEPLRRRPPSGFTTPLFDVNEFPNATLPSNLRGIQILGDEPVRALTWWVALIDNEKDPANINALAKLRIDSYLPHFLIEFCEKTFPPGGIVVDRQPGPRCGNSLPRSTCW
mmetsp:Transcript_6862/g.13205  ORF Transcript_6862/g.13205 Transcript_6862/m.13205 type:complete len:140 (+) Transcript_6862:680-1099(+)